MKNIKQLINEKLTINKDNIVNNVGNGIEYTYIWGRNQKGMALDANDVEFACITSNGEIFLFSNQGLNDFIEKNPFNIDGDYMMVFEELLSLKSKNTWEHLSYDENWDASPLPQTKDIKVMGIRYI